MGFAEKFIASLSSQNLRDDAVHHDLDVIAAAALAGDMGALLCRVKYADGTVSRLFEGNAGNLAQLLRAWTAAVTQKGRARRWVKAQTAWMRRRPIPCTAAWPKRRSRIGSTAKQVCHGTVVAAMQTGAPVVCKACHGGAKRHQLLRRLRARTHQTWSASWKASSSRTVPAPCAASALKFFAICLH